MRCFGKASCAHETSEVEPRKQYALCIAVAAVQGVRFLRRDTMTTTELKEKTTDFVKGELTLTKLDFCLIGLICLFAGICIGLLTAPLTHGVSICSNNGNNNGNNNSNKEIKS